MKKMIFQDLLTIKDTWSSQLWKYFLVSVAFHGLLFYVLVTVPLTTPIDMDFPTPTTTSREPSTNKIPGKPIPVRYTGIPGTRANAGKITGEEPRETLYTYNYNSGPGDTGSNKTGIDRDITPLPVNLTEYKYQLPAPRHSLDFNSDQYIRLYEKPFRDVRQAPVSGLPVKKRTASYQKVKQFIEKKRLPPEQMVKIEEMVNYFYYDYPLPTDEHPFSLTTELAACPWQSSNWLLHIGVQGKIEAAPAGKIDDQRFVIATDIKMKVVFNPDRVRAYRLIGYGHRRPKLRGTKTPDKGEEHGELLMGQSLTTLYEIIPQPTGASDTPGAPGIPANSEESGEQEISRVTVTYKAPDDTTIKNVSRTVREMEEEAEDQEPSDNFKFSAAVAQFGMLLLSDSDSEVSSTLALLLRLAKDAIGEDRYGYRAEFIKLVEAYQQLTEERGGEQ